MGADYENGGFYIGTWAADVGDGLEVDYYFGYGVANAILDRIIPKAHRLELRGKSLRKRPEHLS